VSTPPPAVLVTTWCRTAPARVGQFLRPTDRVQVIGRGDGPDQLPWQSIDDGRLRPHPHLESSRLSRRQLEVRHHPSGVWVRNVGRRTLRLAGVETTEGVARPGDHLVVDGEVGWLIERRPAVPSRPASTPWRFAHPDLGGFVGETVAAWGVRQQAYAHAGHRGTLSLTGPPGVPKAAVAHLVQALSGRPGPRNAWEPTDPIPPQGACCITHRAQWERHHHLGRRTDLLWVVLDASGDEGGPVIDVPGLDRRRGDIPLVARRLLLQWSQRYPTDLARHLDDRGEPKVGVDLIEQLLDWDWTHHDEELATLMWQSVTTSPSSRLAPVGPATNVRTAAWEDWGEITFDED